MSEILLLRNLEIGERFIHASARNRKKAHVWKVVGKCEFNSGHGTSTRYCHNLSMGTVGSKSCNLEVLKTDRAI